MADLFASGRILDIILALTLAEAIALVMFHRRTGRGVAPGDLLPNLVAGAFLLLAARTALAGAWWGWTSACLSAALLAHIVDLRNRWRGTRRPPG